MNWARVCQNRLRPSLGWFFLVVRKFAQIDLILILFAYLRFSNPSSIDLNIFWLSNICPHVLREAYASLKIHDSHSNDAEFIGYFCLKAVYTSAILF